MTPSPGTLTVTFNSYYASNRICYRTGGSGPYTCIIDSTGDGGTPCTVVIPVVLDDYTCDPVVFDGYVQPTCQDAGTMVGAVTFSTTFTPAEPCMAATIRCNSVGVDSLSTTNAGSGYTPPPAAAPAITFSSGAATATAYIADDGVHSVSVTTPTVGAGSYTESAVGCSGTSGAGDFANTYFDVVVVAGVITSITPSTPLNTSVGSGYVITDTITLGSIGGVAGTVVTVTSIYTSGTLLETIVTVPGTYTVAPTATIDAPPAGVTATVDVELSPCTKINITQCDGAGASIDIIPELGQEFVACSEAAITLPADYTQTATGCCYSCHQIAFTALVSICTITYLDCDTGEWDTLTLNPATGVQTACVVDDAWFVTPFDASISAVTGAECPIVP